VYFGPAAVAAYRTWGRPMSARWHREHGDPPRKPGYAVTATGVRKGLIEAVNARPIRAGVKEAM
jgi:hypothetical protein